MAIVRPFRAIRPAAKLAEQVAALPYDVYNREEARAAVQGKPLSFLNIDRPETQYPEGADMYGDHVYQKAHDLLARQISEGVYVQEEKPCYYIYELTMDGRTQTGIGACSSIDDYCSQIVKKHENTREEKEQDRIRHVDACNAQTGPIFLAYRSNQKISNVVRTVKEGDPLYDFVSEDGIRHRVWRISEESRIKEIREGFEGIPCTYIADGHHRAASAVKVGLKRRKERPGYTGEEEFNFFLSVLFPEEELKILPYYRVVKDLNGLTEAGFLERISEVFDVEKRDGAVEPGKKGQFGMFLKDRWYLLTAKQEILSCDPVKGLDVSLLQDFLLHPVLGIGDPRLDARIDFVGGIRGVKELERRVHTDMAVAFSTYPTSIQELFAVADAGLLMPPKSTWFEPKLRSGLLIHSLGEQE